MKAKIRGIYATALTKLLMKEGFQIVQPSKIIQERLKIQDNAEPPDVTIKDRYDLQGVVALGSAEAINQLKAVIHENLEDAIIRKWRPSVGGIYKGEILGDQDDFLQVKIDENLIGLLPKDETEAINPENLIVQVERKRLGRKNPILSTRIKIVGQYAILIKGSASGVSLRVHDLNKRAELNALASQIAPKGWGIIWREPAAYVSKELLKGEIKALSEKVEELERLVSFKRDVGLLFEGSHFMDIEFPSTSKRKLDEFRASVTYTLDGHHFYKSCGGRVATTLEMAEKLIENGNNPLDVRDSFLRQISPEFPNEGESVDIMHVKLIGNIFNLGKAVIESLDEDHIVYSRVMRADGFYDGLGVMKEAGDRAVSEAIFGEWYIVTKYFSRNGSLRGTYININTPIEIYPNAIRYVDLEVDICVPANGCVKILDVEKLENAFRKGLISRKLFEKVKEKVREILEERNV
ncbi:MAG: DUF402 domain-containing protein [Candidatus Bathyarchaeia archaeon]